MRALGTLLNKEVILTPENASGTPLLTYRPEDNQIIHNPMSLEPIEYKVVSREEGLRMMARSLGVDENDEAAIISKLLEAANKPTYGDD